MSRLTIIVAATTANGIGKGSGLPWRLPKEMAYFAKVTSTAPDGQRNAVMMGRNTWESIPVKFRPLQKRVNVVISRNASYELIPVSSTTPSYLFADLGTALKNLSDSRNPIGGSIHRQFVIGGALLYRDSLALSPPSSLTVVDRILLTRILSPSFGDCDVYMPNFLEKEEHSPWIRAAHEDLESWVGFEVPEGIQEERGIQYEFQMWIRPFQ